MWNIKEKDLDEFKITCRNRLSPEAAVGFMLGSIIYTSLIMLGVIYGLVKFGWSVYPSLLEETIIKIELCLYSLQIIFLIVYLFPKARFKFQKLQAIVILLYALQLATIEFVTVVVSSIFGYSNDRITLTYVALLLLGAFIIHIFTTINTFKQASKGAFSKWENSVSFFSKTKDLLMIASILYVLTLLILIYINNDYTMGQIGWYAVLTLILYSVAIGAAEFQLLAYCRFKFPSFYISWEEHERERQEFLKRYKEREEKKAKEIK
ncbi:MULTISPECIES: hypothetical protein [Bacillus]|uniref:hypothetical protein n=1 Tax=Bacillus TaxID=1386 RepID=UPI000BED2151|nr:MULTISPECIES: hypothetical protein [Bacillus]KAB2376010.1 hypothetical protein F8510_13160 [Bacillus sp. RM2(2019)]PEC13659.1 hypothetical protein CON19_27555 [Bacillus thuringiensis]PEV12938.1 hypothetical protein CN418_17410 [Bacillus thuringiensis]PGV71638.1 hypothetical protein COD96_07525 [Bacillus thuringiensis]PGW54407.1 hypothetical protein COE14_20115 [Bacillus thuringiensis]